MAKAIALIETKAFHLGMFAAAYGLAMAIVILK